MNHTVLVYGTLRPFTNTETVHVPGYLYNLGWYPGIQLADPAVTGSRVMCERITVDDERLQALDQYEGCAFGYDDSNSLYTREKIVDPGSPNGWSWIYVYSNYGKEDPFNGRELIKSGDWQEHIREKEMA